MMSASASATASATAAAISLAVTAGTTSTPAGVDTAEGAAIRVTLAPRSRAASARAKPILPDERLVMTRTGSMGSCVPPAVTTMRRPARSPFLPMAARVTPMISAVSASLPTPLSPLAR